MCDARKEYGDIIDLPHHQSDKRAHMSLHDRAVQFAPFAALRGYDDEIAETARTTNSKVELSAEETDRINDNIKIIIENIKSTPRVKITYFVPDEKKDGGEYVSKKGCVRKIDEVERVIHFTDNTNILIDDLYQINIEDTE